jgi:hypothetical protein
MTTTSNSKTKPKKKKHAQTNKKFESGRIVREARYEGKKWV